MTAANRTSQNNIYTADELDTTHPESLYSFATQTRQWTPLQSVPQRPNSNPPGCVKANDQFIFMNCEKAIYRYDIIANDWGKWKEKDFQRGLKDCEAILYHSKYGAPQLIQCNAYDVDQGNVIAVIQDLNPKCPALNSWEIIRSESCVSALFIEEFDEIHLFGGIMYTKHRFFSTKYIAQPNMWRSCYFPSNVMHNHGVVYIPSQHRMLFFGGKTRRRSYIEASDAIWEYDFGKRSWDIINEAKLPYKMYGFGYILTADEQHIVIFGGGKEQKDGSYVFSDEIFVIDLATMNIDESVVKCPESGLFKAVSVQEHHEKLVRAFIRREYGLRIAPELCNLIQRWYKESDEYVHLMSYQRHWRMEIKQIMINKKLLRMIDYVKRRKQWMLLVRL